MVENADVVKVHKAHTVTTVLAQAPADGSKIIVKHRLSRKRAYMQQRSGAYISVHVLQRARKGKFLVRVYKGAHDGMLCDVHGMYLLRDFDLRVPEGALPKEKILYCLQMTPCGRFVHPALLSVCPHKGCSHPLNPNSLHRSEIECVCCGRWFRSRFACVYPVVEPVPQSPPPPPLFPAVCASDEDPSSSSSSSCSSSSSFSFPSLPSLLLLLLLLFLRILTLLCSDELHMLIFF